LKAEEEIHVHRSRPAILGLLLALLMAVAACGSGTATAPATDDGGDGGGDTGETVSLAGGQFAPSTLTIPAGTTVTFTDTASHTVTEGTDGTAVEDPIVDEDGGADIVVSFDEPGTYDITCKIHPNMNMSITVEG
jgi:plastocyanin